MKRSEEALKVTDYGCGSRTGIMDERFHEYLLSLEPGRCALLEEMRIYAHDNYIPIVREETESLLRTLTALRAPYSILEIGTAIGYSAIVMAQVCEAHITTIESFDKRIPIAIANIERAGFAGRISIIHGDAGSVLKEPGGPYDLIFLDAAKGQYLSWLPDILRLMGQGSLLIADNVLQDGTVTESRYLLPHRARTTHERIRDFLYIIKHDRRLCTSVLTVGDGVSVSVML